MSMRYLGGFISASYNPLKVPNAPTIGTVTAGDAQVSVTFTAPSNVGGSAITSYQVLVRDSSSGATFTGTGSASPVVVTGLTNGNTYTAQVAAVNSYGPSAYSASSGSFKPVAPKLFAWGFNGNGALGQNNTISLSSPVQVGALTNWANLMGGGQAWVLATQTNNTLWSWGSNSNGQLGQNNLIYRSSPTQIGALTTWSNLGAGNTTAFAIKTDGTLWAWGLNTGGQQGQSDRITRSSPVQVEADTNWTKVSGAFNNVLITKTNGTLWSCGNNTFGQLGQNDRVARSSLIQVGADTTWLIPASGSYFSLGIKTNGTLWSWGYNAQGQLGQNDTVNRSSPVQVGALTNWANVSGGDSSYYSLAVKTDGTLWAWGQNSNGQLGQNDLIYKSSPVQVGSLTTWSVIPRLGGTNVAAIKTDGTLWTWGNNGNGQLGQSNLIYRSSPVQVGSNTSWINVTCYGGGTIATLN